ncbi:MAG TPA: tRNA preQ1(34) S-adenosylmethionine ribosyltransferase-isomerase QueA, partial [Terriglobia bacterium]|nr:tRNA preQ1(34) S-adenosylmethionine ribosyltransferase-isomerase QueA [Terriglobia bacterium]
MHVSDFDYYLPPERIARTPAEPRDASRMMVLDSRVGNIVDTSFRNLPDFLRPTDVLVLNDTRVIRARTRARLERRNGSTREMEVFFAEPLGEHVWQVLCKPGRRIRPGDRAIFGRGEFVGIFQESTGDLHALELESAESLLKSYGQMPLPPYIGREPTAADDASYQTVFGLRPGAVAAPTAGLHFTTDVLNAVRSRGIEIATITLHVGIGTFLPVRTERPEEHILRPEVYEVGTVAATVLQAAVREQRRVVAVGTTTTRTLEFLMLRYGRIEAGSGYADIYILPGFEFRIVGALLTNFHLPRSTLLMLAAGFCGRDTILKAYEHAVAANYR